MSPVDDGAPRSLRVVSDVPTRKPTPAAERARRYRARRRGEDVPLRTPGPKRSSATEREFRLKDEISELRGNFEAARLQLRLAHDQLARRRTVAGLCDELLAELRQVTASADPDEVRELLRDVAAEVDERRYSWPD